MTKSTLHLIHGYIASGKTTYAKKLEAETGAIRFTLDEWMVHFYGVNPPADQFAEYEDNIKTMIWQMAEQFLKKNISVILDYGFWKRRDRDDYRNRASDLSEECLIHSLTLDDETALSRLKLRTDSMLDGALFIDENTYHALKDKFEPLGDDEIYLKITN
jgi:predicted kinase